MNLRWTVALSPILLGLTVCWFDMTASAATITVEVGGDPSCTKSGTGNSVDIAMNCPSANPMITIAPKSTGAARVEVTGDPSQTDILRITNAVLTAKQNLSNYHIIFYRDDPAVPDTAQGAVWYKLWLKGTIPPGNSLTGLGTVEHPVGSTPVPVGTKTVTGVFDTSASAVQWTQALNQTRKIKVDLTINLASGRSLDLGNWVRLASQPSGDENRDDHIWMFSTTGETTDKWFGEKTASLTEDGLVKKEEMVNLFFDSNWNNLTEDFARGHGEYLSSLASLLEIPRGDHSPFFDLAQQHYAHLSEKGQVDPYEMLQLLERIGPAPLNLARTFK